MSELVELLCLLQTVDCLRCWMRRAVVRFLSSVSRFNRSSRSRCISFSLLRERASSIDVMIALLFFS